MDIKIKHPDSSGVPGRAREILAKIIGWDKVRKFYPAPGDRKA